MILLSPCVLCKNATSRLKKILIGSFLRVTHYCDRCQNKNVWESQPFIGNVHAGNLFTSAAILFSGSLPSKTLHLFQILNCASLVKKTFFRHQSTFLQPAVRSVWKHQQNQLLAKLKEEKGKLDVGGDDRADSPGHSAKYGTYTHCLSYHATK